MDSQLSADRSASSIGGAEWTRGYQVHVEGRLSRAVLAALGWSSRVEREQNHVQVCAGTNELAQLLRSCMASGLVIERVTRVDAGARLPTAEGRPRFCP